MKKLFYYSSIYTVASVITKVISFFVILLMGKYLSVKDFAIFGLLYSMHQGIVSFAKAGLNESVIGFFKDLKSLNKKKELFSNALLTIAPSSSIIILLLIIFYITSFSKNNPDVTFSYFLFAVFSGIFLSFSIFQSQIYRLKENHFASIIFLFLPQLLLFLSGGIALYASQNINYFFLGSFSSIGAFLLTSRFLHKKNNLPFKIGVYTNRILLNSIPYYLVSILGWLGGFGNNFIINMFFGSLEIGAYTFLFSIGGTLQLVANSINQVWAPRFYNSFNVESQSKLESKNNFIFGLLALVLGITISFIIIIYPFLIELIGGNLLLYVNMKQELYLIAITYVIYTPIYHYSLYYYVYSKGKEFMLATALSYIIGLICMIVLIKYFGEIGIYYGVCSFMLSNLIILSIHANKEWSLNINWISILISILISLFAMLISESSYGDFYALLFVTLCGILTVVFAYRNKHIIYN
jgi:O-antigen/teichoic acid export membrane protein